MKNNDLKIILETRVGSHAYGTNTPESDEDFKGVAVPPLDSYLGFQNHFEQQEETKQTTGRDRVIYNIRKFFDLATDCNPSIIEVLFCDPQDVVLSSLEGDYIRSIGKHFLSKKAKHTYSGYAIAQLKRIRTHRSWLINPPKQPPSRQDLGLPPMPEISKDEIGTINALLEQSSSYKELVPSKWMETLEKEKQYKNLTEQWKQYNNWVNTRNSARAVLEAKYGYDTKHGSHLVRLLRTGMEVLQLGEIFVRRPDAAELLAIRNGAWSYDQLEAYTTLAEEKLNELYATSSLPDKPDRQFLNDKCIEIICSVLKISHI